MHPADGSPQCISKTSTTPVGYSSIGWFGRGVQLSPISTTKAAWELASQAVLFCPHEGKMWG